MIHDYLNPACDLLAALLALGAAAAWFQAARAPTPFITFPDSSDPDAVCAAIDAYAGFVRGTVWNRCAAILAGLSALAIFASWLAGIASVAKTQPYDRRSDDVTLEEVERIIF